jgi:hypothetical protein
MQPHALLINLVTTTSVENTISGMEYPALTTLNGQPTYEAINKIRREINANASDVDSHQGSINGHLVQIMLPATYLTVSATSFITPPNPGPLPPRPCNLFPRQWEDMKLTHQRGLDEYTTSNNLDKAINQQVIKAITDPIFLKPLENHISGYSGVSTRSMIQFLFDAYGNITPLQLDANDKMTKEQWDPSTPIIYLF